MCINRLSTVTLSHGSTAIWKDMFPINDLKLVAIVTNWQLPGSIIGCLYRSPSFGFYSWITKRDEECSI